MQIYNDDIKIIYHQTKNPLNLYIITMMIYWWYHKPWAPPLQSLMGPNWTLCARNILEPWNHAEKYGKDGESLRVGRGKHVGFPHDFNRRILDDFDVPRKNCPVFGQTQMIRKIYRNFPEPLQVQKNGPFGLFKHIWGSEKICHVHPCSANSTASKKAQ